MTNWQPLIDLIDQATQTATLPEALTDAQGSADGLSVAPAMVCRVEQGNELLFEYASGWLDPESKTQPTTTQSIFDYASLTKLFTTTACLRLIDAGLLRLDTPLPDLLPEFGHAKVLGGAEDPITKQPIPLNLRWLNDGGPQWFDGRAVTIRRL